MNVILSPQATSLWDAYQRLPPSHQLFLRLKSLLLFSGPKSDFIDCLKATGIRSPTGKAWSPQVANPILDDLVRQGLLSEHLTCPAPLLHPVAMDAAASNDAGAFAAAIRRTFPVQRGGAYSYIYAFDRDALFRLIRLAVYTNEEDEFSKNSALCERCWRPFARLISCLPRSTTRP